MMTALCELRMPDCDSAFSSCGRGRPPNPSAPTFRKFRREMPSQNCEVEPLGKSVSIIQISDEFAHRLHAVLHPELRATRQIRQRDLADVDPERLVKRGENLTETHRPFNS